MFVRGSSAMTFGLLLMLTSSGRALPSDEPMFDADEAVGSLAYLRTNALFFNVPSDRTGAKVAEWHEDMNVNPEELGEYAEGDIVFSGSKQDGSTGVQRSGLKNKIYRWPNGVVPYNISSDFEEEHRRLIQEAIFDYDKYTCVKFKKYTGKEPDYVQITGDNTGCWSSIGRVGGRQTVNLQIPGCVTLKGTVIHELMHALGFLHEQSREDRDEFVKIQCKNIESGYKSNFRKAKPNTTDSFNVPYDYGSVMHYSPKAFSRNGLPTITAKKNTTKKIGQRTHISKNDIKKIRRMYKCPV